MARATRFRGSTRAKRRTHWVGVNAAASISSTSSLLMANLGIGHEGETIVRVRGLLTAGINSASAVGDGFSGALGIGIVTAAAAAAGVASVPTPLTEVGWDGWMLHQFFGAFRTLGAGGNGEFDRVVLESKAMRKATEDDSLVFVLEVAEIGTATLDVLFRTRVLSMF